MAEFQSAKFSISISYFYASLIFQLCLLCLNSASEISRPRGVSISKASFYVPNQDFVCFDNSNKIAFTQINDDYCDCSDGSDEPGTSACPNGFFHCTNAGFKPQNIPSSRVNDGICDCCDGADEYAGKVLCENTCGELGKAERLAAQKRAEIAKIGNEARLEASKRGKLLKQEKAEKLEQLEKERQESELIKIEKERFKLDTEELEKSVLEKYKEEEEAEREAKLEEEKKAEEQEARNAFDLLDSNENGRVELKELQTRQMFDQNRDGQVSDDEAKFFLDNNEESDWDLFLESVWPRMKPSFMLEKGLFKPPKVEDFDTGVGSVEDVTHEYQQQRQQEIIEGHEEAAEEEEEEDEGEIEEPEERVEDKENVADPEPSTPQYDEETLKIIEAAKAARAEFEEADRNVRDIQREISQLRDSLEKDFGPDEEFAPLDGQCFEYTDREYLYKLCAFDQATQQPKSGGSETRLGVWNGWVGDGDSKYLSMLYDKGQSCWNGPQRSTQVTLICGTENALIGVSEPNKCEYHFQFSTPSACRPSDMRLDTDNLRHDEL